MKVRVFLQKWLSRVFFRRAFLFKPVLTPQLSRLLMRPSRHNSRSSDVSVRVRVVGSAHSPYGQRLRCCDRSAQTAGPVPHPGPLAFPAAAAARRRCSLPHVSTAERVASNSWWHCNPSGPLIDSSYVGAEMSQSAVLDHKAALLPWSLMLLGLIPGEVLRRC